MDLASCRAPESQGQVLWRSSWVTVMIRSDFLNCDPVPANGTQLGETVARDCGARGIGAFISDRNKQYAGLRKLVDNINEEKDPKVCPFQGKGGGK